MTRLLATMLGLVAFLMGASGVAQEGGGPQTYRFFVLNEPLDGQEAAYLRFYEDFHLADVVSIPGFVEGRRYILNDRQLAPKPTTPSIPRYLTLYTIRTQDLGAVKAEIARRIATGETRRSTTYDPAASQSYTYREIGPQHVSAQPFDEAPGPDGNRSADFLHFVQTAAVAGREEEYDRWYTDFHLAEMIRTRGFRSSQRLELADPGRTIPPPAKFAAVFTFHTGDDAAVIAAFKEGAKVRTPSEAADRDATRGYTFRAIGAPLTHREAIEKKRMREAAVD